MYIHLVFVILQFVSQQAVAICIPIMTPILDNPVWHALISGNKTLAQGTATVKAFSPDVSPIVGLETYTPAHFDALHEIIAADRTIVIFSVDDLVVPNSWNILLRL